MNRVNIANPEFEYDAGDPEGFRSGLVRPGPAWGAKQLGTTVSGVNDLVTGRLAGASAGVHDIDTGTTSIQSPAITLPATGIAVPMRPCG